MQQTTTQRQDLISAIATLPDEVLPELAIFLDYLHYKTHQPNNLNAIEDSLVSATSSTITSLRGIAKRPGTAPSDAELQAEYADYLTQKYQ